MNERFSAFDYAVFALMLLVSAGIGFYFAWKERNKKNVNEILLGGRNLSIFPVAMSIMASFTSVSPFFIVVNSSIRFFHR